MLGGGLGASSSSPASALRSDAIRLRRTILAKSIDASKRTTSEAARPPIVTSDQSGVTNTPTQMSANQMMSRFFLSLSYGMTLKRIR